LYGAGHGRGRIEVVENIKEIGKNTAEELILVAIEEKVES